MHTVVDDGLADDLTKPACMSHSSPKSHDPPVNKMKGLQLMAVCIAQLNESVQITMPYTVAVFMVREFQSRKSNTVASEQTIGRLTGILAACFCAAQFLTSIPWGRVSDKLGRKPLLVMSNLSSCISVIGFGLSPSFSIAIVFRLAGGLFNCTFVCLKAMIGESCDPAAQARPLSYLALFFGLGCVIGPSLGGILSRPCDTFDTQLFPCGEGQFFRARPFFLPCAVVSLVSFAALLSSLFFLEETLPSRVACKYTALPASNSDLKGKLWKQFSFHRKSSDYRGGSSLKSMCCAETELASSVEPSAVLEVEDVGARDVEKGFQQKLHRKDRDIPLSPFVGDRRTETTPSRGNRVWDVRVDKGKSKATILRRNDTALQMEGQEIAQSLKPEGEQASSVLLPEKENPYSQQKDTDREAGGGADTSYQGSKENMGGGRGPPEEEEEEEEDMEGELGNERLRLLAVSDSSNSLSTETLGKTVSEDPLLEDQLVKIREEDSLDVVWYKDKQVLLTILGYMMICLLYNLVDEVIPIYASAARSDGGLGLSTSAVALPLALGGVSIVVWSMFFYPMFQRWLGVLMACKTGLLCSIPLCMGMVLPSLLPLNSLGMQLILAAVLWCKNIMATNSFTSSMIMINVAAPQKSMGAVNGASQAAASFVRAAGPALGGVMWGFSVSVPMKGHQILAFGCSALGFLVPLLLYHFVNIPALAELTRKPTSGV